MTLLVRTTLLLLSLIFLQSSLAARESTRGNTHRREKKRIVGGRAAEASRFPYFTYLMIQTNQGRYECGGVLIHHDIVMSAAHCVEGVDVISITAIVNMTEHYYPAGVVSSYFSSSSAPLLNTGYEQVRTVENFRQHPSYYQPTESNDMLLLQLSEPVLGIPFPALPAPSAYVEDKTPVTTIGFGDMTSGHGVYATILMAVEVEVVNHDSCRKAYSRGGHPIEEDIMICAARDGKVRRSCILQSSAS
jgi:trypsin